MLASPTVLMRLRLNQMLTTDFHYDLPAGLIASYPTAERSASRLLCLDRVTGQLDHRRFTDLAALLQPGDLLVFNDTRVIPARLYGTKETGGRVEVLIERLVSRSRACAHIRASKSPAAGSRIMFPASASPDPEGEAQEQAAGRAITARVVGRNESLFELEFELDEPLAEFLERSGHMPLPPYIRRTDEAIDRERYQTVYATVPGAVAAPTAGLHFDQQLLGVLKDRGIDMAYITLHVGAGTFQPVREQQVENHRMHSEWLSVPGPVVEQVNRCRQRQGRVIAVGTTSVRSLEAAADSGELRVFEGETDIFIYPGYAFRVVDAMITNFHLPESTLLMLVSAFAGKEKILDAYGEAIAQKYRFFSYGDAMVIA